MEELEARVQAIEAALTAMMESMEQAEGFDRPGFKQHLVGVRDALVKVRRGAPAAEAIDRLGATLCRDWQRRL